ncbi:hypothetical protein KFL_000640270 [Klebsormidium nitens]|uniref:Uncharacterized protein n=1 Tax=Klebsormidium nitens TaxID=105231 RepID=A0A1Y1HQG0_KLENI|nr:hypothetical protein KFL_000640270 [Klebsormidium nitens]|eukprot:GAQ80860.1 hypothetical protein KFL_000640270 [Klebsormidium nitens]
MAHCAPSAPLTSAIEGLVTPGHQNATRHIRASIAPGITTASLMHREQCSGALGRSSHFLGNACLFGALHESNKRGHRTRFVCLFGRGRHAPPSPPQQDFNFAVVESRNGRENVPLVSQPVPSPFASRAQQPPAAAFLAAIVFAGMAVLAVKVVNHLRGGPAPAIEEKQPAFVGYKEDAEALTIARARLAQAFGDDPNEYNGEIVGMQIASMMGSAVDYLYALANEVAEVKAMLDDKEERLALAYERSKQDADERKELIRRISMAEAELVEEQLKQAADKAAFEVRDRTLDGEKAAEVERLIAKHQAELDGLRLQFDTMERNAAEAAAKTMKLNEEVQALKRGLKEKEGQLAAAAKKADEDKALNASLSARLESANSELQSALSRETELLASLQDTTSGVQGAEEQLDQMQHRHEAEIRAVRGIAQAQAKGLEERLKGAQDRVEEVQALKEAEIAAREAAEASAAELQSQVDQLEQDLVFLETRYKDALAKASATATVAEEPKQTDAIEKLKEALESKTQQAAVAKELVLQFMENEREKDFELKQLRRESSMIKERLSELEGELEASVAARIEGALDGKAAKRADGDAGGEGARARFEEQLAGFRAESEREVVALRAELKSAREQLSRARKQHAVEMEASLGKLEREFRATINERESERDGCLLKLGTLEEGLTLEIAAREAATRELGSAQEKLLEWERRANEMEVAHAAALETEREASRQKLEALFLDCEKARDEAREKEGQRVTLAQQTEQLQVALAEAESKRDLQAAKANDVQAAFAFNEDIVEEARAKQSRYEAELEALANQHATRVQELEGDAAAAWAEQERLATEHATRVKSLEDAWAADKAELDALANQHATRVKSLEDARAADAAAAQAEQERLQGEVLTLENQIRELKEAVEGAEKENEETRAKVAQLESANADAAQRLARMDDLDRQLSAKEADAEVQRDLWARIAELGDVIWDKDNVISAKDDVIAGLEAERAKTAAEALERLEETDALKEKIRALLEEQDMALEEARAEGAAGDEELTRVRQRLREVERALQGSQDELRGAQLEERRLELELTSAKIASHEQRQAFQQKVDGLERALQASGSELQRSAETERGLSDGIEEERRSKEGALGELQDREAAITFLQRYFEERSSLDVQLSELGSLAAKIEAAKRDPDENGPQGVNESESLPSLEAEFSRMLRKFENAVAETAETFGFLNGNGLENDRGSSARLGRVSGARNGVPAPRALGLVGVEEVAGSALSDLNERLFTAEKKADDLQVEIRQRVVRQMEWQDDKNGSEKAGVESVDKNGTGAGPQKSEIQDRVSQMIQTLAEKEPSSKEQ